MKTERLKSLLVLAPWGLDVGFRLGGSAVKIVSPKTLNDEIEKALKEPDIGIIAIPETMKKAVSKRINRRLAKLIYPMVIYFPFTEEWVSPEEWETGMDEIVQKAIGYRLRIKLG